MPITQLARCLVHIDGLETSYLRTGHGPPVVLLLDRSRAIENFEELVTTLSPHHRLTIPALGPDHHAGGLRTFLDGIGLVRTNILAIDSWAVPALAFSLSEPDRVERVALVESRQGNHVAAEGLLERVGEAGVPLFVTLGSPYNDEGSGLSISSSMADALIHFFSGVARDSA